jgi:hypothetical protein
MNAAVVAAVGGGRKEILVWEFFLCFTDKGGMMMGRWV